MHTFTFLALFCICVDRTVEGYFLHSPSVRWTYKLPAGRANTDRLVRQNNAVVTSRSGDQIFVTSTDGSLHLLDAHRVEKSIYFEPLVQTNMAMQCRSGVAVAYKDGNDEVEFVVYAIIDEPVLQPLLGQSSRIIAVDPRSGQDLWTVQVSGRVEGTPVVSPTDSSTVYVIHNEQRQAGFVGRVSVIRVPSNGLASVVATLPSPQSNTDFGPFGPATASSLILGSNNSGRNNIINQNSDNSIDVLYFGANLSGGYGEVGRLFMFLPSANNLDLNGWGSAAWQLKTASSYPRSSITPPAVSSNARDVYLNQQAGRVTGWSGNSNGFAGGSILQPSPTDLYPRWEIELDDYAQDPFAPIPSAPVLSSDNSELFLAGTNTELICLQPNGRQVWRQIQPGTYIADPVLTERDGSPEVVYFMEAFSGSLRQHDAGSGELNWSLNCREYGSCATWVEADFSGSGNGNMIYFADTSGLVVALEVAQFETPAPSDPPTPTPDPTIAPTAAPTAAAAPPTVPTTVATVASTVAPTRPPSLVPSLVSSSAPSLADVVDGGGNQLDSNNTDSGNQDTVKGETDGGDPGTNPSNSSALGPNAGNGPASGTDGDSDPDENADVYPGTDSGFARGDGFSTVSSRGSDNGVGNNNDSSMDKMLPIILGAVCGAIFIVFVMAVLFVQRRWKPRQRRKGNYRSRICLLTSSSARHEDDLEADHQQWVDYEQSCKQEEEETLQAIISSKAPPPTTTNSPAAMGVSSLFAGKRFKKRSSTQSPKTPATLASIAESPESDLSYEGNFSPKDLPAAKSLMGSFTAAAGGMSETSHNRDDTAPSPPPPPPPPPDKFGGDESTNNVNDECERTVSLGGENEPGRIAMDSEHTCSPDSDSQPEDLVSVDSSLYLEGSTVASGAASVATRNTVTTTKSKKLLGDFPDDESGCLSPRSLETLSPRSPNSLSPHDEVKLVAPVHQKCPVSPPNLTASAATGTTASVSSSGGGSFPRSASSTSMSGGSLPRNRSGSVPPSASGSRGSPVSRNGSVSRSLSPNGSIGSHKLATLPKTQETTSSFSTVRGDEGVEGKSSLTTIQATANHAGSLRLENRRTKSPVAYHGVSVKPPRRPQAGLFSRHQQSFGESSQHERSSTSSREENRQTLSEQLAARGFVLPVVQGDSGESSLSLRTFNSSATKNRSCSTDANSPPVSQRVRKTVAATPVRPPQGRVALSESPVGSRSTKSQSGAAPHTRRGNDVWGSFLRELSKVEEEFFNPKLVSNNKDAPNKTENTKQRFTGSGSSRVRHASAPPPTRPQSTELLRWRNTPPPVSSSADSESQQGITSDQIDQEDGPQIIPEVSL